MLESTSDTTLCGRKNLIKILQNFDVITDVKVSCNQPDIVAFLRN